MENDLFLSVRLRLRSPRHPVITRGRDAGICKLFPVKRRPAGPAAEEAVRQAVTKAFPGCRVSEIREVNRSPSNLYPFRSAQ